MSGSSGNRRPIWEVFFASLAPPFSERVSYQSPIKKLWRGTSAGHFTFFCPARGRCFLLRKVSGFTPSSFAACFFGAGSPRSSRYSFSNSNTACLVCFLRCAAGVGKRRQRSTSLMVHRSDLARGTSLSRSASIASYSLSSEPSPIRLQINSSAGDNLTQNRPNSSGSCTGFEFGLGHPRCSSSSFAASLRACSFRDLGTVRPARNMNNVAAGSE